MQSREVADHLIANGFLHREEGRTTCPMCGPDRKKFNEKTFSVRVDGEDAVYMCHHCEKSGKVSLDSSTEFMDNKEGVELTAETSTVSPMTDYSDLNEDQIAYIEKRGIAKETAEASGLVGAMVWQRKRGDRGEKVNCIGFQYKNHDGTMAIKWRDAMKNFTQVGAARSLWGIENFKGGDLIITEGEFDALSFREAGVYATSVPNGAPAKAVRSDDNNSKKFAYLWEAKDAIAKADRVIIAGDQDAPGEVLPEEIARRIGKAKCWRMSYPPECKDANDVLVKYGKETLLKLLNEATPWPIGGLRDASEYKEEAVAIWRDGMSRGVDVPVGDISEYYRPSPQTLTICTGVPGSGKSTFLTWLSVILAKQEGWTTAVFSAETSSQVHLLQLASLHSGKPFRGYGKMSEDELRDSIDWVSDRFVFLDESETSIQSVIERAQAAVLRNGVRCLMIDPFNFVTMDRPADGDNGQYGINKLLVSLKTFAVEHDVAVWLVAHPTKMYRDGSGNTPIPTGYDISGSAHFFNVADSGITISRSKEGGARSTLTSWKARFSWLGRIGSCDLAFDATDGSFSTIKEWGMNDSDWDLDGDMND